MELTPARLKQVLRYDPITGLFTRRFALPGHRAGEVCGTRHFEGYTAIKIDGKSHMAHRLAFLYITGAWPKNEVDHVNLVRDDNRWSNLREATRGENQQNKSIRKDNKSGFAGVTWDAGSKCWRARISVRGKQFFLGHFDRPEVASVAYREAKANLHSFNPQVPL